MKINKETQDHVLSSIGLTLRGNVIAYDASRFKKYISQEYINSDRKQTDENYRMFEITLLHADSGLRIVYTTTESYYGDTVEYKVIDLFIITSKGRLQITDVDFTSKVFIAHNETIPFAEVDKVVEHQD